MINHIHGILTDVEIDHIVVEAGGVGYGINVPATVISELPPKGSEVTIYTHYAVKEDSQSLFGFLYREDREMFRSLIGVSGIGPKGALAILSVLKPDDLRMAIITGDAKSISRAQGIGGKTAQRIILDLRDKVGNAEYSDSLGNDMNNLVTGSTVSAGPDPISDALGALSSLGYTRMEAGRILSRLEINKDMTAEDILKAALKSIRL